MNQLLSQRLRKRKSVVMFQLDIGKVYSTLTTIQMMIMPSKCWTVKATTTVDIPRGHTNKHRT